MRYFCFKCGQPFETPTKLAESIGPCGPNVGSSPCCGYHFRERDSKGTRCSFECCKDGSDVSGPKGGKRQPGMNHRRAALGAVAVHAFARACRTIGEPVETNVGDLLGDLMHFCDEQGVDFEDAIRKAKNYYYEERRWQCKYCKRHFDAESDVDALEDVCQDCVKKGKTS